MSKENSQDSLTTGAGQRIWRSLATVLLLFVVVNLIGLYGRFEEFTLLGNLLLLVIGEWLVRRPALSLPKEVRIWLNWSYFWLFLGLLFEPYEGGIKKDISTLSYFFVTSGLAGMVLLAFKIAYESQSFSRFFRFLSGIGKNPMVGYVAVTFLVIPLAGLIGINDWINSWGMVHPWVGVFKGLVLTMFMIFITLYTVKIKHFWKT